MNPSMNILDKIFISLEREEAFPKSSVCVIPKAVLDHSPILDCVGVLGGSKALPV